MTGKLKRDITKDMYERGLLNRGYLTDEDMPYVFNISERFGYGVYSAMVKEEDGKYYVTYYLGSSCD